ncbi:uncharacterized protein DS421_20g702370 [Arachis hypogaea]|nr:uncharacterized protein DS421_20g702370 [Arachis hypogaea]
MPNTQPTPLSLSLKNPTQYPKPPSKFERSPQPPSIFKVIAELFSSGRGCCRRRRGQTVGAASRVEALLVPVPLLSSQEGLRELGASPSRRVGRSWSLRALSLSLSLSELNVPLRSLSRSLSELSLVPPLPSVPIPPSPSLPFLSRRW